MIHQVQVGAFQLSAIQVWDVRELPAPEFLKGVQGEQLAAVAARQPRFFSAAQALLFTLQVFVLRRTGQVILVDTGDAVNRMGNVLEWGLAALGLQPEDVNVVFLTHRDADHVGGTLNAQGQIRFPNARYVMSAQELQAFREDEKRAALFHACLAPLLDSEKLEVLDDNTEFLSGLTLIPTPGHRAGASSLRVQDGGDTALILGDTWHFAAQVARPEWSSVWDEHAEQAAQTRREILAQALEQNWVLAAPHIPFGGLGRIQEREGQREWVSCGQLFTR
ncbi:MBL fold metallo-hydrolase [Deinococcus fonticola]|uniref:MBL fold metallo-hydrolase n=1 Tax=Deinococcus fonticola TaxID=2528713 RepID=UPI00107568DF|nr:MBL fold metallo-hydrolase [Deinococcus fonticola]